MFDRYLRPHELSLPTLQKKYNRNFSFPLFFASRQHFALKNIIGTFNGENGVSVGFGLNSSDYIFVPIILKIKTPCFGFTASCCVITAMPA
jgi:hypothetical protein